LKYRIISPTASQLLEISDIPEHKIKHDLNKDLSEKKQIKITLTIKNRNKPFF